MRATSTISFKASRAPVPFSREKQNSGGHIPKRDVEACVDTLSPGGEVRGCCEGCILSMPEISPFVFMAASYQLNRISRTR